MTRAMGSRPWTPDGKSPSFRKGGTGIGTVDSSGTSTIGLPKYNTTPKVPPTVDARRDAGEEVTDQTP